MSVFGVNGYSQDPSGDPFGSAAALPVADQGLMKPEQEAAAFTAYPSTDAAPAIYANNSIYTDEETVESGFLPDQEPANVTAELPQASYPSAEITSPITSQILVVRPVRRYPGRRMRQRFQQFVSAEQALTAPIRGVARIAQRQFALRAQQREESYVREKEQAREVLNFTVHLAETMFHYGADAIDVDSAIVSVCSHFGLNNVEISITNQSIIINYVSDVDRGMYSPGTGYEEDLRFSHTVVRVVRTLSENYAALSDIYRLINEITSAGLPMSRATERLQKINATPKLYSPLWVLFFNLIVASSFTLGVGGSWRGAIVSVLAFTAIHFMSQWIAKFGLPVFFTMIINAAVLSSIALYVSDDTSIFSQLGFQVSAPHVVGAGLMMLMPTFFLVSLVQDALHGFPLTAAGKLVTTSMGFLGLIIGISTAVEILTYAGASGIDVQAAVFNPPPVWVSVVCMMIGSMACAGVTQGRAMNLVLIAAVSLAGQTVYYGFSWVTGFETTRVNTALAACTVGALSAYLAYKLHAPQIIFSVCGVLFLLPGLTFFRGFYAFSVHTVPESGVEGIVAAASTIVALAGGVVLGAFLMQNLIERFSPTPPTREALNR